MQNDAKYVGPGVGIELPFFDITQCRNSITTPVVLLAYDTDAGPGLDSSSSNSRYNLTSSPQEFILTQNDKCELLDTTPDVNDITTPDMTFTSVIADEIESENLEGHSEIEKVYMQDRPTTQIFCQNRTFTYNHLPSIGNACTNKSKQKKQEGILSVIKRKTKLNPDAQPFKSRICFDDQCQNSNPHVDAITKLREIRVKHVNNVIIGHLNINSLRYKFNALCTIMQGHLDILVIGETKLDDTFPEAQFLIPGYKKPYRLDRNEHGGGVMIYVREDIPSDRLQKHNIHKNVESVFIEINLRKNKLLLVGIYHSTNAEYGTSDAVFFEQLGLALDVYSNYDKYLLAGDFNVEEDKDNLLDDFMHEFHSKNLVKEPTCFKNSENPTCIDLFVTNCSGSFQKTTTVSTGLSDFHKMIVTVLKTTFPKVKPKLVSYRNFSKYEAHEFEDNLRANLESNCCKTYDSFENIFLRTLDNHAPIKKKLIRANHKPYVTKKMRKAIMLRSQLQNKVFSDGSYSYRCALRKQKNYCNRLYKRERKKYYSDLNMALINDNRKFWETMKPLFGNKGGIRENIVLVNNDEIISEDTEIAQTFNDFFEDTVNSLGIVENKLLLHSVEKTEYGIEKAIKMYETHPSIISIKEHVRVESRFYFSTVTYKDIQNEILNLNPKKAGTFMNIPAKQLKEVCNVICEPLMNIWNEEVIKNKIFPHKLKLADISPIFKKLQNTLVVRPVSVLPVVSKIFERIMDKQTDSYIKQFLSPFLCGYRKGYNCQYALLAMIEKWKMSLDSGGHAGGILMDLSKAFDTINHQLLIAKLHAYGFSSEALEIVNDYLKNRWQRTKINNSFSTWSEILCGMPQGSVLGPKYFNIYLNDLFYLFINTSVCNIADDTTPYACDADLHTLLHNLESDTASAIIWFEANYMMLNQVKCHFIISSNSHEHFWVKVGQEIIWESHQEKLLGLTIDKELKFDTHLYQICKKASAKVTALARLVKILPFEKKKLVMNSFIESQFSYCPLLWMFCSRRLNSKVNYIHERGLRMVYEDTTCSFKELLVRDRSVFIHHRNIQLVAIEMFKVINNMCPEIMKNLFQLNLNRYSEKAFFRPNVDTVYKGECSLRWFGPVVWDNMLPANFKSILTLETFKEEIKKWVPDNCPCRLCKTYINGLGFVTLVD